MAPFCLKIEAWSILLILLDIDCFDLSASDALDTLHCSIANSFLAVDDMAVLQTHHVETAFLELVSEARTCIMSAIVMLI